MTAKKRKKNHIIMSSYFSHRRNRAKTGWLRLSNEWGKWVCKKRNARK